MDLKDYLKILTEKINNLKEEILTEEATKNAFVMPFLQALGYDVFNPLEVKPEFVADIPTKKGEKIDYAIIINGKPTILIECKDWRQNLKIHDGQLLRYFTVSNARFGVLTNGIIYKFYSDLVELNKMDDKPFLEINLLDLKDNQIEELKKFHKTQFNAESIINTASELKYMKELKLMLQQELTNPSPDFIKHFAREVYPSVVTAKVLEQFTNLTKKAMSQYFSDMITERLKTALDKQDSESKSQDPIQIEDKNKEEVKIITTDEEIEGYMIVKAILRQKINPNRIYYRDTQSYMNIILDDSIRKIICRLYLNSNKKFIGLFDEAKKEIKYEILSIDDIFKYSDKILKVIELIDKA